uniref:Uncharacterized protein n=1 Tax=Tanacetum cinerariifolium TaxID=118510 RepID=A0A6L2K9S2_TANCI|nr:hypothetical protein [Tanacetum cinerariifolium]
MHVKETIVEEGDKATKITSLVDAIVEKAGVEKHADESPYDTKSEIKFVKRAKLQYSDEEPQIKFIGTVYSDIEDDTNDIVLLSRFEAEESDGDGTLFMHKDELSKSDEVDANKVLDVLVNITKAKNDDLNASADKPSLSDPFVADAFEERILDLLSDTLKNILPQIIKDSINQALFKFKMIKELVILIETEAPLFKASLAGEKKSTQDTGHAPAQGEPQPNLDQATKVSTALILHSSEEEPSVKKMKVEIPNFTIPSPTPLISIMPQNIIPPIIINNIPFDKYVVNLFSSSSSKFSLIPPQKSLIKGTIKATYSSDRTRRIRSQNAKSSTIRHLCWSDAATPSFVPEIRQLAIKDKHGFVIHPEFGLPAQSVRSSNAYALDSLYLLVLVTRTSQSKQHVITSSIHVESYKSPTESLFDVGSSRISIFTVNTK